MIKRTPMSQIAALLLMFAVTASASPQSNCYTDAPPVLLDSVDIAARNIVSQRDATVLTSRFAELVSFTVADAYSGSLGINIKQLERYRYLGETARTDKQIGASAKAAGSTTAAEKPGIIDLLGFAIERGAIQQEINDTTLTLSTSPYAFIAAAEGDTDQTYRDYELFTRLGLSATFNLTNQDNVLANASRKQLTEWSAKLRLTGDRSTRSQEFQDFWDKEIQPLKTKRLTVNTKMRNIIANDKNLNDGGVADPDGDFYKALEAKITEYLNNHTLNTDNETNAAVAAIKDIILCSLKSEVFDKIKNGQIQVTDDTKRALPGTFKDLGEAHVALAAAQTRLQEFLKDFMKKGTLSTFAYTNHRTEMGSDYSELKLLFERHVKPMDLVANIGVSLYHNPNPMLNQDKIRDFTAALSLEGSSKSPFVASSEDLSRITYSLTGRYERLKENENMMMRQPDIASLQLKVEVPIGLGLKIPIAYTYSSATEMSTKKENKFNIGLHFDLDKLFSIARARTLR